MGSSLSFIICNFASLTADGYSSKDGDDLYYKQLEQQQADLKKKVRSSTQRAVHFIGSL